MCGRFTLIAPGEAVAELFRLEDSPLLAPRYNIAPTQAVAAVRASAQTNKLELTHFHWGLIPFWAKDPKIGARMINARSETASEKPSFLDEKHLAAATKKMLAGYYASCFDSPGSGSHFPG